MLLFLTRTIMATKGFNSFMTEAAYRNQSIDLICKSIGWFLYDNGLRHERVKRVHEYQGCIDVL